MKVACVCNSRSGRCVVSNDRRVNQRNLEGGRKGQYLDSSDEPVQAR